MLCPQGIFSTWGGDELCQGRGQVEEGEIDVVRELTSRLKGQRVKAAQDLQRLSQEKEMEKEKEQEQARLASEERERALEKERQEDQARRQEQTPG